MQLNCFGKIIILYTRLQDIEPEADVTGAQEERNNQSNVVSFQDHVA